MHIRNILLTAGLFILSLPGTTLAERAPREEMETDRPDFTEGTRTVAPGIIQVESGYTFTRRREQGNTLYSHYFPELLLRFGLNTIAELRVEWAGAMLRDELESYEKAVDDGSLGVKWRVLEEQAGDALNVSGMLNLGVPTGAHRVSSRRFEPGGSFLLSKDLTSELEIASNSNLSYLGGEQKNYTELSNSLAIGAELTERIGFYTEYYHLIPLRSVTERTEHYLNGGFTLSVTPDLQLDLRVGSGLNSAADNFIAGAGFAYRY